VPKQIGNCYFIFHSRDKPPQRFSAQNHIGSGWSFLFGSTTSGKTVNERTAMQTTAVNSCVRILAEAVAGLPLHIYKYNDSGDPSRAGSKDRHKHIIRGRVDVESF